MAKAVQKINLSPSRDIPFNKLVLSQSNVRRIKAGISIEDLAASIARRGLIQSLSVVPLAEDEGGKKRRASRVISERHERNQPRADIDLRLLRPVPGREAHTEADGQIPCCDQASDRLPCPRALALCTDDSVIGTAFYVMSHVAGRVFCLDVNWKWRSLHGMTTFNDSWSAGLATSTILTEPQA